VNELFSVACLGRGPCRLPAVLFFSRLDIFRDLLIEALSLVKFSIVTVACCLPMKPTHYDSANVYMIDVMQKGA